MRLKSLPICIIIVYALLNFDEGYAQCSSGSPQTVTYTNTGSPVSLTETYNFPKFNPSMGTLIGVNINLTTSGFTMLQLVNGDGFANSFTDMEFRRRDRINAPGLGTVVINDTTIYYPDTTLGASDNPTVLPPYTVNGDGSNEWWGDALAPDNRIYGTSVGSGSFASYTGASGSVAIVYSIIPSFFALGIGSHYTLNYVTMATNINMSVTYTYCSNTVLPIGRVDFFAKSAADNNVELSWTKEQEENGITYGVEMSTNGADFTSIGTMQSQKPALSTTVVKYEFGYDVPSNINSKMYFRLKQTNAAGHIQYSAIRIIDAGKASQSLLTLFPNPADKEVTLQFKTAQKNTLQVELINSTGQVVENSKINTNGSSSQVFTFRQQHASGVYFIRATNLTTKEQNVSRLVIK
ncbi:MAG: choice-of-anchor E domain-containing protein [Agriterribacter sp.]